MPIIEYQSVKPTSKELGLIDSAEFADFDKIVDRKGYEIYRDMQYDDQIKFCLLVKKLLLLAGGWSLQPADETPQAKEQADFVSLNFANMQRIPDDIMWDLLSAFDYGFCLPYDVELETDKGRKPIGEIVGRKLRVKVKTLNEKTGEIEFRRVVNWFSRRYKEELVCIYFGIGTKRFTVKCTKEHPILTEKGWKKAIDVSTKDRIFAEQPVSCAKTDGRETGIVSVPVVKTVLCDVKKSEENKAAETVKVYDIEVEGTHNYFANKTVVHNSVGELCWKIGEKQDVVPQALRGKILLDDIRLKFPWDVEFEYDEYGNLNTLKIKNEKVRIDKFVIYSFMSAFGNRAGTSDLKGAYSAWWFKENVWKFWARLLERFGSPVVMGHIPQGATADEADKFFAIINRIHDKTGIILPRGRNGEEFTMEYLESKREGGTQFLDAINNADSRIARSFLFPRLFGAVESTFGSYALGAKQIDTVLFFLKFYIRTFADGVMGKQVIKPMIDYNFEQPLYPKLLLEEPPREIVAKTIEKINQPVSNRNSKQEVY